MPGVPHLESMTYGLRPRPCPAMGRRPTDHWFRGGWAVALSASERQGLIERYALGPRRVREALSRVPDEARKWRPGPGKWSVHEVVVHCADAETNASVRLRYLLAAKDPLIVGYDQETWA